MKPSKRTVFDTLLDQADKSLFVVFDPRAKGVSVPAHLAVKQHVTLEVGLSMVVPIKDLLSHAGGFSGVFSFNRVPCYVHVPWSCVFWIGRDIGTPACVGVEWPEDVPRDAVLARVGRWRQRGPERARDERRSMNTNPENPKPWWYALAERFAPNRCREIPEAVNPDRIVLRQVALIKRYLYLQQFASSENMGWMHSHQWRWTFALGLWGSYTEKRLAGYARRRQAPYFYVMGADVVHHVQLPSAGHTSLFLGLWRDDDLKHYYPAHAPGKRLWSDHIKVMVKRI